MDENTERIGSFAGKVWKNLDDNDSLPARKLMKKSRLKNDEFHQAVGWLAKENKINKSKNNLYSLGKSNIKEEISEHVEKVWHTLENKSRRNVATISKSTGLRPKKVYAALGWLAREDKLEIFNDKTLQTKYSLKR